MITHYTAKMEKIFPCNCICNYRVPVRARVHDYMDTDFEPSKYTFENMIERECENFVSFVVNI